MLIIIILVASSHGTTKSRTSALETRIKDLERLVIATADPEPLRRHQIEVYKEKAKKRNVYGNVSFVILILFAVGFWAFIFFGGAY